MGISVDDLLRQVRNLFDLEVLMMKRYINYSILYTVLAMISGVFYREFTRMNDYTAWTTLSVVHTHYFILDMMFFLILVCPLILKTIVQCCFIMLVLN